MMLHLSRTLTLSILLGFHSLLLADSHVADNQSYQIYGDPYPPYNFETDGEVKGYIYEILLHTLKNAGIAEQQTQVYLMPWTRARRNVERFIGKRFLLSIARTPYREELYHWLGPIVENRYALFGMPDQPAFSGWLDLLDNNPQIMIGVMRSDHGERVLVENGIPEQNTITVTNLDQLIKLLLVGRVNYIYFSKAVTRYSYRQHVQPAPKPPLTIYHEQTHGELWIGMNLSFKPQELARFREALVRTLLDRELMLRLKTDYLE